MYLTRKAGIEVRGNFMLALPGETPELAQQTIDFAKEIDPDYAKFNILSVWHGTELYEHYAQYGTREVDYDKLHFYEPGFVPSGYKNKAHVALMQKRAFRQFYFRPMYIVKRIMKIRSVEDVLRHFRGLMAVARMN
jgi:radical SAM superfamily enzyme YgiQ (UPF0313 family)